MIQNVFGYLLSITCTVAIGRLGAPELAASSLANSIYVVTGLSMVLGLSTGVRDGACAQHYEEQICLDCESASSECRR